MKISSFGAQTPGIPQEALQRTKVEVEAVAVAVILNGFHSTKNHLLLEVNYIFSSLHESHFKIAVKLTIYT